MADREEIETKAGHPPALKVGGMRVAQHARPSGAEGGAAQDPENPQIPAKDSDQAGDASVHGIGGLQSKPQDLLVKESSGIPVTAKDLEIQNVGIKHTHNKGVDTSKHANKQSDQPNLVMGRDHRHMHGTQDQPRNHGANH